VSAVVTPLGSSDPNPALAPDTLDGEARVNLIGRLDDMVDIVERPPTLREYKDLREVCGWGNVSDESTQVSIDNALYSVCLEENKRIVALGRVVGDGGMYFYVQDVIVVPSRRGLGYSRIIMNKIMEYLKKEAPQGAFVGLMAAENAEPLYKKYGFIERPCHKHGAGMFQTWKKETG
jgi:GNAT superfamily N-acetyltransferase